MINPNEIADRVNKVSKKLIELSGSSGLEVDCKVVDGQLNMKVGFSKTVVYNNNVGIHKGSIDVSSEEGKKFENSCDINFDDEMVKFLLGSSMFTIIEAIVEEAGSCKTKMIGAPEKYHPESEVRK